MAEIQEYKCPCCGGAIEFNSKLQKMKCPYCDTEFEMETLKAFDETLKNDAPEEESWSTDAGKQWEESEADGLRTYVCKSCGGEIVGDETMAATSCPYCNNPVVILGQFAGNLKPDYVIPFKLDKEAAKKGLMKHISKKPLLPKVFKEENHIDEIKGIYVPFWLFDSKTKGKMRYRATRVRTWSDSNYYYTETSYYAVVRGGQLQFEKVPVDGSSKMEDSLMESIEPYNSSEIVDFQTAYLAGFLAEKYDVGEEQSVGRARERMKNSTEQMLTSTVYGYSSVVPENSNVTVLNAEAKYALYPVWLLNTTWNGKQYTFAMNGQTGKFIGDLPVDKKIYIKWLLSLTGIASAVSFLIGYLLWLL